MGPWIMPPGSFSFWRCCTNVFLVGSKVVYLWSHTNMSNKVTQLSHVRHVLTTVSVAVPAVAVEAGGGSDLHLQLFALRSVGWHGVAVVGPETTLALRPHRLSQLIGRVRAGAPAAQKGLLRGGGTCVSQTVTFLWQQDGDKVRLMMKQKYHRSEVCVCVCVCNVLM